MATRTLAALLYTAAAFFVGTFVAQKDDCNFVASPSAPTAASRIEYLGSNPSGLVVLRDSDTGKTLTLQYACK